MSCCRVGVTGVGVDCVISTFPSNHNGFGLCERGGERRRRAGNVSKLKPPSQPHGL